MKRSLQLLKLVLGSLLFIVSTNNSLSAQQTSFISQSKVFTADSSPAYQSMFNNPIIALMIDVEGPGNDLSLTNLVIDASLCTNFSLDVTLVKVYYTGNDSTFSNTSLFWSGIDLTQALTGNQQLLPGKNYFWVCFDINNSAVANDTLDASCSSFSINGNAGNYIPDITSPSGYRIIHPYIVLPRKITGKVKYNNTAGTGLSNVIVLLNDGYTQQQVYTNSSGYYQFLNLPPSTYYLLVICNKPWAGANAVDALSILRHFVGIMPLTGLALLASDVDYNGNTNSTDAFQVLRRFTGIIDSFPLGDWIFESVEVVIDGTHDVTRNIYGLCVGDVNRSYIP